MSTRHKRGVRDLCAHPEEGDGIDPRLDELRDRAERGRGARDHSRRDAALGAAAHRAIAQELTGMASAIDMGIRVMHVEVSAGGAHLRVWIVADAATPPRSAAEVERWRLAAAHRLRSAFAARLARERVPNLDPRARGCAPWDVRQQTC